MFYRSSLIPKSRRMQQNISFHVMRKSAFMFTNAQTNQPARHIIWSVSFLLDANVVYCKWLLNP